MTDGLGVESLRNLVFSTATCQMGRKEAFTEVKMSLEMEVTLLELDCMQCMKSSERGVTVTPWADDIAAHETENERVRTMMKMEELSRDFFMSW